MSLNQWLTEVIFSGALFWVLGLAVAIILGRGHAYVQKTVAIVRRLATLCARKLRRGVQATILVVIRWIGRRLQRW